MTTEAKNVYAAPMDLGELGELIRDEIVDGFDQPQVIVEMLMNSETEVNDSKQKIEESRMFIFEEKITKDASAEKRANFQQSSPASPSQPAAGSSYSNTSSNSSYSRPNYGYGQSSSGYGSSGYGYQTISAEEAKRKAEEEARRKSLEKATRKAREIVDNKQKKFYDMAARAEGKVKQNDSDIFSRMEFFEDKSHHLSKASRKDMMTDCVDAKNSLGNWFSALAEIGKINRRNPS